MKTEDSDPDLEPQTQKNLGPQNLGPKKFRTQKTWNPNNLGPKKPRTQKPIGKNQKTFDPKI